MHYTSTPWFILYIHTYLEFQYIHSWRSVLSTNKKPKRTNPLEKVKKKINNEKISEFTNQEGRLVAEQSGSDMVDVGRRASEARMSRASRAGIFTSPLRAAKRERNTPPRERIRESNGRWEMLLLPPLCCECMACTPSGMYTTIAFAWEVKVIGVRVTGDIVLFSYFLFFFGLRTDFFLMWKLLTWTVRKII